MSKDQIEEMAKIIAVQIGYDCAARENCDASCIVYKCHPYAYAEILYNAGYRKQSEGCDFCKTGEEKCGTCVKFFDYYEDGGSDRCSIEYGNEKCAYYKPVHHCPNCGAKMKGGAK